MRLDRRQQRVAAGRQEHQERRLDRIRLEVERGDVAVQVVDGDQRQPAREGKRLRRREADEERADQPWPLGDGHRPDVVQGHARVGERALHRGHDQLQVPARRDLRDDAAVRRVQRRLRADDAREDDAVRRHDRGGGLVARRLDAEDHTGGSASFHMMSASSRLSV